MIRFLLFLLLSSQAQAQFNDTIFYSSGMVKVLEVIDYDAKIIYFKRIQTNGDTLTTHIGTFSVMRFVCYDEDGMLQYDSNIKHVQTFAEKESTKYPDSASDFRHQASINL